MPSSEIQTQTSENQFNSASWLARPKIEFLADMLTTRLANDSNPGRPMPLPSGVHRDLRPILPNASNLALGVYLNRKAVNSYPLLFTTLALANPN